MRTPVASLVPSSTVIVSPTPRASPSSRPASAVYVTRVRVPHGCLVVGAGITGVKVYLVQQALHLVGHRERYDADTSAAVREFQAAQRLPVTGLVNAATWRKLRTGYPFCVDRYTQQPLVGASATAGARIEAMIGYATGRQGVPYLWGGAGPIGFDCSGLVLHAMYAGGRVVPGLDTDRHVRADFRTTQYLYDSRLTHVPFGQRRRGDLVFYGSPISHVAIYLGDGRIVEAVRPMIRVAALRADGLPVQPYVLRPFPR